MIARRKVMAMVTSLWWISVFNLHLDCAANPRLGWCGQNGWLSSPEAVVAKWCCETFDGGCELSLLKIYGANRSGKRRTVMVAM